MTGILLLAKGIPDLPETEIGKVADVCGGEGINAVVQEREGKPGIDDPPAGELPFSRQLPDLVHHRRRFHEAPVRVCAVGAADGGRLTGGQGTGNNRGVPEQKVKLHKDELTDHHVIARARSLHEIERRGVLPTVAVLRIEQQIGIE